MTDSRLQGMPLLAWPRGWGSEKVRLFAIIGIPFAGALTIFFLFMSLDSVAAGDLMATVFAISGVLVGLGSVLIFAGLVRVRTRRLPKRMEFGLLPSGRQGLYLPFPFRTLCAVGLFLFAGAVFLAARSFLLLESVFAGTTSTVILTVLRLALAVTCLGAAALCVLSIVVILRSRSSKPHLLIDGQVIEYRNVLVHQSVSWEDIQSIEAGLLGNTPTIRLAPVPGAPVRVISEKLALGRGGKRNRRLMEIPPGGFDVDPAMLLCMMEFYHRHPELRHELASDAVIRRMQSGELVD